MSDRHTENGACGRDVLSSAVQQYETKKMRESSRSIMHHHGMGVPFSNPRVVDAVSCAGYYTDKFCDIYPFYYMFSYPNVPGRVQLPLLQYVYLVNEKFGVPRNTNKHCTDAGCHHDTGETYQVRIVHGLLSHVVVRCRLRRRRENMATRSSFSIKAAIFRYGQGDK